MDSVIRLEDLLMRDEDGARWSESKSIKFCGLLAKLIGEDVKYEPGMRCVAQLALDKVCFEARFGRVTVREFLENVVESE